MENALARSGTTPDGPGQGNRECAAGGPGQRELTGTGHGRPHGGGQDLPAGQVHQDVSPSIASQGCSALAATTRPTRSFGVGSQLGMPP